MIGIGTVQTGIGILSGGLGLDSHPKDAERLGRNAIAYGKAIVGDDNALKFLLYRSQSPDRVNGYVKYDAAYMGSLGAQDPDRIPVKGWPTGKTRDDARRKYNDALNKRQQVAGTVTGIGVGIGTGSEGETTGEFLGTVGLSNAPRWLFPALLIGGALLVYLLFFRKG